MSEIHQLGLWVAEKEAPVVKYVNGCLSPLGSSYADALTIDTALFTLHAATFSLTMDTTMIYNNR